METEITTEYENYTEQSRNYDNTRIPIGADTILAEFRENDIPLNQQNILDAGCGTGNYLLEFHDKVNSIVGLDRNQEMLKYSNRKLEQAGSNNYELHQGELPEIPFEDCAFDGIMINQVIHHLDTDPDFPVITEFCQNAFRTLKPVGRLIINTCSPEQIMECYWYVQFIRPAGRRLAQRYIPIEQLIQLLQDVGFKRTRMVVNVGDIFYGAKYYDLNGPLKPEWRAGDSIWSLESKEELEAGLRAYRSALAENKLENLLRKCEKRRQEIGQGIFVIAEK